MGKYIVYAILIMAVLVQAMGATLLFACILASFFKTKIKRKPSKAQRSSS